MAVMGNSGFWLAEPLKLFYSERKSPNDLKPTTKISHLILIQQDEEKMLVNFCANQMPGQLSLRKVAHFCACSKPEPGFPTSYVMGFFNVEWVQLRWEVIVLLILVGWPSA